MAGPSSLPLYLQTIIAIATIVALALMPSRHGPMIVVPLWDLPVKPWLDARRDATVLGLGRLPGSVIVSADRDLLLPIAIAHHAILLPALPALCAQNLDQRDIG